VIDARAEEVRFRRDVLWNASSLVVLATSGILLQSLIGRHYGAAALGAFNQGLAAYIVFSQVATAGVHQSVLRFVSEHAGDREHVQRVVGGALRPLLLFAVPTTLAFFAAAGPLGALLESELLPAGMRAATLGLFCFACNKVLISVVNGERRMRAFAVYQALRYVLILCGLLLCMGLRVGAGHLLVVFTFAEGLLLVALAIDVTVHVRWWRGAFDPAYGRTHLWYGLRGLASGVMIELNSRVDVLMLGWYLSDELVGVYSYAALFAEGFFQLVVVLQNNYNPLIARHLARGERAELLAIVRKDRRWFVPALALAGLAGVLLYPHVLRALTGGEEFAGSYASFAILILGILLASRELPFQNALLMGGRPGWHSVYMFSVVGTNAVANAILIPRLGIAGAAVGTAIAFGGAAVYLQVLSRRLLDLRL
jgi:O-antigen/teichoic acid export membrane protein